MKRRSVCSLSLVAFILFWWVPAFFSGELLGAQAEPTLGLRLVGTAVTEEPGKSFAMIEIQSTGGQGTFREGDRWGEMIIKKILPGSVVISTATGDTVLSMVHIRNGDALPSAPQMARLARKEVDSTLPDEMQFIREIGVRPQFERGQPAGFVIYSIEPESIFGRMGLEDGDVIVGMNGKSFATTQPTMEFYDVLKKGGMVSLAIKREDSKMDLHFEIR
jgi:general secretion pathway protein C